MRASDPQTRQENILYLAIWTLVFAAVPVTLLFRWLSGLDSVFDSGEMFRIWGGLLPFLGLFLLHNYAVAPLLVRRRKGVLYVLASLVLLAVFAGCIRITGKEPQNPGPPGPPPERFEAFGERTSRPGPNPGFPEDRRPPMTPETMKLIIGFLLMGVNLGCKFFFVARRNEQRMQELRTENLHQQLEYLRYQINPHFFMNTLNNIHALVDIDPDKAKESIEELSKLMRYVLYDGNQPTIPLSREVEYLHHFVSLMRIRYADSVRIGLDLPEDTGGAEIPPLLLASFVENAFKHGISYEKESFIQVSLNLEADSIVFRCANSRQGAAQARSHGIGLENVHKRLELLYGSRFTLEVDEQADLYDILLRLPLKPLVL